MGLRPLILGLVAAACVGDYDPSDPPGVPEPDAAANAGPGPSAGPDSAIAVASADAGIGACEAAVANPGSGQHHSGDPCLDCHDGGGGAPRWTLAGTVFTTIAGGTPVVGATIVLFDAGGAEHRLVTHTNGNFWTDEAIVFPIAARASQCPATRRMAAAVTEADANCNDCHRAGMRIALP